MADIYSLAVMETGSKKSKCLGALLPRGSSWTPPRPLPAPPGRQSLAPLVSRLRYFSSCLDCYTVFSACVSSYKENSPIEIKAQSSPV